jgi:hypothetical protein
MAKPPVNFSQRTRERKEARIWARDNHGAGPVREARAARRRLLHGAFGQAGKREQEFLRVGTPADMRASQRNQNVAR